MGEGAGVERMAIALDCAPEDAIVDRTGVDECIGPDLIDRRGKRILVALSKLLCHEALEIVLRRPAQRGTAQQRDQQ